MISLWNNIPQVVDDIFGQRTHQTKVASLFPVIIERLLLDPVERCVVFLADVTSFTSL